MLPEVKMDNTQNGEVVVSVITVTLKGAAATHSSKILKRVIEVLRGERNDISGYITGEVLLGDDTKQLAIVTEWRDRHSWSVSRYDTRIGNMLEVLFANSTVLDFKLYRRKARFVAASRDEVSGKTCASLSNESGARHAATSGLSRSRHAKVVTPG
jgi:hypothetical protein